MAAPTGQGERPALPSDKPKVELDYRNKVILAPMVRVVRPCLLSSFLFFS